MEANDMAAMRKALKDILKDVDCAKVNKQCDIDYFLISIEKCAKTALSKPPRQCDVGTAEEQNKRFVEYCKNHRIKITGHADACNPKCPCRKGGDLNLCTLAWAQMTYEKGETDGSK